ncbi:MAG: murein biosynthesis integral membrane protein MurJ [Spirochaetes bacterium]|nr:murein biosynthesis integral membrane protein MurJ [Spirochaetota bacterium]
MAEPSFRRSTVSTMVVMVCTFLSRLFGFVRIAVIGAIFGASGEADVLNAVFTIPNNLRKLMAEGALSSAFIPVLSKSIVQNPKQTRKIVQNILSFQGIVLIPVLILSTVFAYPIVKVLLDFPEVERIHLATKLFRWMIHYLLLVSISAVLMGVLNAHHRFLVPSITPILFSVFVISSVILFWKQLGIFSMVIGVLGGGIAQVLFQLPQFFAHGYTLKPDLHFDNPPFRQILKQWAPVVLTASIYTINEQIAIRFATALEDGSTSAMSNALVFWQLPFGIFSASVTTVLFPRMSRQAGSSDFPGVRRTVEYGFRYLIILLIPSALILSLLGKEVIAVAMQRRNFTSFHTLLTFKVLVGFNVGLLSVGAFNFFQRFFYSLDDYKTPLLTAFLVCGLDILLSLILKETALRVSGLAYANSIAFTIGLIIMYLQTDSKIGPLDLQGMLKTLGNVILACLPVSLFCILVKSFAGDLWKGGSSLKGLGFLLLTGLGAGGILLGMYKILGIDILNPRTEKTKTDP